MEEEKQRREEKAIVLDFLPNGYPFEDRPGARKMPIVQAIGKEYYALLELVAKREVQLSPGNEIYIGEGKREQIHHIVGKLPMHKLTPTARQELEFVIKDIVDKDQEKCVERVINKGRSQGIMLHPITKQGFFTTSKTELKDIAFAWFGITLAFSFLIAPELSTGFFAAFGVAGLTVGIGFLLHELGHKAVAQYYGCSAEFHAFKPMIYLAIILAIVFKVIFAAPGAVFISGPVGTRRNGIISLAGPVINFGLALG